ncbi:hypothetical protein [Grimontia marina]|uniref:Uncharacterized protein n=1 Tax=Grimontia marina TaxID=646534 RepID=A0A128F381_9GAMM|nr:hypothetical protein [Grimontia marina]CZF80874.1 hypothetical protein GMA8713_01634 [Grimontia marina]
MKIKFILPVIVLFLIAMSFTYLSSEGKKNQESTDISENSEVKMNDKFLSSSNENSKSTQQPTPLKKNSTPNFIGYVVNLKNTAKLDFGKESDSPPTEAMLSFEVVFENQDIGKRKRRGILRNFRVTTPDKAASPSDENEIGFLYAYKAPQLYTSIDMLGLSREHPLGSAAFYISNLSYSPNDEPVTIKEASRSAVYQYQIDGASNTVTRRLLDILYTDQFELGSIVDDIKDSWSGQIGDDGLLTEANVNLSMHGDVSLDMSHNSSSIAENNKIKIGMTIVGNYQRFDPGHVEFKNELFTFNANARFNSDLESYATKDDISNDEQYYEALNGLSNSLSYTESVRVGQYLLNFKTLSEIKSMLSDEALSPLERQAILMAIQDANQPESEQYLGNIINDPDVPYRYRAAGMVNLAHLEGATDIAMEAFKEVIKRNDSPMLSETAMFNIGNLANKQTTLRQSGIDMVSAVLQSNTSSNRERLIALKSAANIDDDVFTPTFIKSMNSDHPFERNAAVEGALYRPDGRADAVEHLLNEEKTVVLTTASRFFSTNEMTFIEQGQFYNRLVKEESDNKQSALATILLANEKQRPQMISKLEELAQNTNKPGLTKILDIYQQQTLSESTFPNVGG